MELKYLSQIATAQKQVQAHEAVAHNICCTPAAERQPCSLCASSFSLSPCQPSVLLRANPMSLQPEMSLSNTAIFVSLAEASDVVTTAAAVHRWDGRYCVGGVAEPTRAAVAALQ